MKHKDLKIMKSLINIGLVGDFDSSVPAHQAIPLSLKRSGEQTGVIVNYEWIPTKEILSVSRVNIFDGLWCVPASPYRNMDGALLAIRYARENMKPFLGTCGGFQHVIIEYARNVLGWQNAEHAETASNRTRMVITLLACTLVEATDVIRFFSGTRIANAYGTMQTTETYRCRYGLNPEFQKSLLVGPLRASADDHTGEIRAVELEDHPFFVATLFQPERAALQDHAAPLIDAFVCACCV